MRTLRYRRWRGRRQARRRRGRRGRDDGDRARRGAVVAAAPADHHQADDGQAREGPVHGTRSDGGSTSLVHPNRGPTGGRRFHPGRPGPAILHRWRTSRTDSPVRRGPSSQPRAARPSRRSPTTGVRGWCRCASSSPRRRRSAYYTPLDEKPKGSADPLGLARCATSSGGLEVTLLVDRWDEDWTRLAWVRLEGTAADLLEPDGAGRARRGDRRPLASEVPAVRDARPRRRPDDPDRRRVGWSAWGDLPCTASPGAAADMVRGTSSRVAVNHSGRSRLGMWATSGRSMRRAPADTGRDQVGGATSSTECRDRR